MNLTKRLLELNQTNIVPKKFDTKIKCVTYILSYYQLKNTLKDSTIFDLFYDLRLKQLQYICHKVKDFVNDRDKDGAFNYLTDIIEFVKC